MPVAQYMRQVDNISHFQKYHAAIHNRLEGQGLDAVVGITVPSAKIISQIKRAIENLIYSFRLSVAPEEDGSHDGISTWAWYCPPIYILYFITVMWFQDSIYYSDVDVEAIITI